MRRRTRPAACLPPPTPRRSRGGPHRWRWGAATGGRTAEHHRWRSPWPPARPAASARPTSRPAEGGGEARLVEPVAARDEGHHEGAVEREHEGLHDLAHLHADGAGRVLGRAGALRELPELELQAERLGPRSATFTAFGCTVSASREDGTMRDWVVGGALILSDEGVLLVQNRRRNGSHDWTPPGGVIDEGETPDRGPHPRGRGGDRPAGHRVGGPGVRGALRSARHGVAPAGGGARRGGLRGRAPRRRPRWDRRRCPLRRRRRLRLDGEPAGTPGCASRSASGWPSAGTTTTRGPTASTSPAPSPTRSSSPRS